MENRLNDIVGNNSIVKDYRYKDINELEKFIIETYTDYLGDASVATSFWNDYKNSVIANSQNTTESKKLSHFSNLITSAVAKMYLATDDEIIAIAMYFFRYSAQELVQTSIEEEIFTLKKDSVVYEYRNGQLVPVMTYNPNTQMSYSTKIYKGTEVSFVKFLENSDKHVVVRYNNTEHIILKSDLEGDKDYALGELTDEILEQIITDEINEKSGKTIYLGLSNGNKTSNDSLEDMLFSANDFVSGTKSNVDSNNLQNFSGNIYNILLIFASAISVIMGLMLGIKFILSSIEEKAQIKQLVFPYLIGCIVVFGSFGIWKLVVEILKNVI